jgi:Ser/Thr protein kinase RdoA (MazF antagonist)
MHLAERLVRALAVDEVEELGGGHQSRVFRLIGRDGMLAAAKVMDASMVNRVELDARLDVTAALADLDPRVCGPLLIGGQRVIELTAAHDRELYIVCFEFATGRAPEPAHAADAERMGTTLCQLHASMSQIPPAPLPLVGALRTVAAEGTPAAGEHQLLHGDFNASNLRQEGGVVRIFDLDDCGYGPPAFDVANALYMVLFDGFTQGAMATYQTFRRSFLAGYVGESGSSLPEESVDRFIDLRVQALRGWLDDLDRAPIGIRTASRSWQRTLRSFVANYRPATH